MIGVKRGKTCVSESRLVSNWLALLLIGGAITSDANVSAQNKKRRNSKLKPTRTTFDIQLKTALESSFSTEQQLE